MPLTMPEHHAAGEQDKHGACILVEDEVGKRVSLYIHAAGLRRIGQAAGFAPDNIDKDLKGHTLTLLASILREAGAYYDRLPMPKPVYLELGKEGTWHRPMIDLTRRLLKDLMAEFTPTPLGQGREVIAGERTNPYGVEVELDGSGVFGVWTEADGVLHGDLDGRHYDAASVAEAKERTIEIAKRLIKSGR